MAKVDPTRTAPQFAPPEVLKLTDAEKKKISRTVNELYRKSIQERKQWEKQHLHYDAMFRLAYEEPRQGPWEGSSDLHVPMPYWVVDSVNVRLVSSIWGQLPLVAGRAEEDDDEDAFRQASTLVDYLMQPKRMDARAKWALASKIRCIHGWSASLISYVTDSPYAYRTIERVGQPKINMENGTPVFDENGNPEIEYDVKTRIRTGNRYRGPILHPLNWDDVVTPHDWMNLQPRRPDNPGGADWVGIRQMESLSYIWNRRDAAYPYVNSHDEAKKREWWVSHAPAQDRSTSGPGGENQNRSRQQDRYDGQMRNQSQRKTTEAYANPEFEVLTWMMPWEVDGQERECVFFVCTKPEMTLGAYLLADINWREDRPILEQHYQRVGTGGRSMGVMEIVRHLSAELDTIHNMRVDVGFATNMPFFFYRASSSFRPEQIVLKPMKGVPVDDVNDVRFPQLQSVTSFYHEEEQLLYTLVERVLGVTDLFLGISPTRGAAARHATGFVGTQQEALARTSEVLTSDAESFAFLCRTVYNMEVQFGPEERMIRLQGKEGPANSKLSRNEIWMQGEYDFRLGANAGMFSSHLKQQQGMAILQLAATSPFINSDLSRRWEAEADYLNSIGVPDPERFIGPKDAIANTSPKPPDEEEGEMVQSVYGPGNPAPTHANDNDLTHIQSHIAFTSSPEYSKMGFPNYGAFVAHMQLHQKQMQQKQQMQQQQAILAAFGGNQQPGQQGPPGQPTPGQEPPLNGTGNMGAMGDLGKSPGMMQQTGSAQGTPLPSLPPMR